VRTEGLILAGGSGRRIGGPKALLPFHGVPLLLRVARVLLRFCPAVRVSTRREFAARLEPFGYPLVLDEDHPTPISGPLAGLRAGCLAAAAADRVVAVAVDHPFLSASLLEEELRLALEGPFDAVLPGPAPELHPLHAVYAPRSVAAAADAAAAAGHAAVHRMLFSPALAVRWLSRGEVARFDPDSRSLLNVNSREDLLRAEAVDSP
jgi:molybdopterin-guanine dinucleotide biosynthesis protein A